jgi:agmatine deiminase
MTSTTASTINNDDAPTIPLPRRRWPAEWESHTACLILIPHNPRVFRVERAQAQVWNVARCIASSGDEDVLLFCPDSDIVHSWKEKIKQHKLERRIHVLVCPSNDTWARDTGPTFVVVVADDDNGNNEQQRRLLALDWDFNAYGGPTDGCYWPCDLDRQVCTNMCREIISQYYSSSSIPPSITRQQIPLVLEGGSIHTDGQGTILTTRQCLLNENRNPSSSRSDIERVLLRSLGCRKIVWLPSGLAFDDDTDGHVDNVACFARPTQVVLSWTDDDREEEKDNYERCRAAMHVLSNETDARGRSLTVHKLHLPPPMVCLCVCS